MVLEPHLLCLARVHALQDLVAPPAPTEQLLPLDLDMKGLMHKSAVERLGCDWSKYAWLTQW